jgi:PAS domain S-box-containing protein
MAILVFLIAATVATVIIGRLEQDRRRMEYTHVAKHADDYAHAIQRHIEQTLSATYALAALVRRGNGVVTDFEATAREMLTLYPGISSLQLAPGGVVQQIVPLAGNEKALGYDLLQNPARSKEARRARETGQLTLAGPFDLIQGGLGAAGRLPVFLNDRPGPPTFWGFTIVLLRFPEALAPVELSRLVELGVHYELWRIQPDTGQKQIIAAAASAPLIAPIDQTVEVPNATWTLSIRPAQGWDRPRGLALQAGLGLLLSLLMAWLAKLLIELNAHKQRLEAFAAEIKTREADLNHAQSVARIGSWTVDLIHNDTRWSAETYRLFGVPPGVSMNYPHFLESVHPDDRVRVDHAWQAALNGAPYDLEHRIVVDGTIRWVHERAQMEFAGDGTLQGCLGTVQDITERKEVEEALRIREQQYRLLIQHLHAGVVIHAPDTRILLANEQAAWLLGLSREQMLGKTALDPAWCFVRKDETLMPLDEYPVNRVLTTRQPVHNLVLGIHHPSVKEQVWVLVNAFPESDALGNLRQVVVTFIDITEQRQIEAQLRESEAHYRLLFEAANDGIVFHALESDQNPGGFIHVNPVICRLLGYSADEMRRLTPLDIQEAADLARTPQEAQALHDQGSLLFEKTLIGKDGRRIPVEIHARTCESGGQTRVLSIIRDITDRKRSDAALLLSEQRFRQLFNSMSTGFALHEILVDDRGQPQDYRFLEINPAFEQMTGLKIAALIGKTVRQALPDIETAWIETYGQVALTGLSTRFENYTRVLDKTFEVIAYCPQPGQFACLVNDITERKRMEAALRNSEERFRKLFQNHTAVMLVLDPETGNIVDANEAAAHFYGRSIAELKQINRQVPK